MKLIRSIAAIAMAGLAAIAATAGTADALGVPAATAVPAASAASVHASAGGVIRQSLANEATVDTACPFHSNRFVTYYGGCASWINWSCRQGNEHSITPPDSVSNDCTHDVVLFSNSNETGSTLCILPFTKTGPLNSTWRSFRVRTGFTC
jgi:hypothetical protein